MAVGAVVGMVAEAVAAFTVEAVVGFMAEAVVGFTAEAVVGFTAEVVGSMVLPDFTVEAADSMEAVGSTDLPTVELVMAGVATR
jgi:hypothetical protein